MQSYTYLLMPETPNSVVVVLFHGQLSSASIGSENAILIPDQYLIITKYKSSGNVKKI